jgi:hypothetical protein
MAYRPPVWPSTTRLAMINEMGQRLWLDGPQPKYINDGLLQMRSKAFQSEILPISFATRRAISFTSDENRQSLSSRHAPISSSLGKVRSSRRCDLYRRKTAVVSIESYNGISKTIRPYDAQITRTGINNGSQRTKALDLCYSWFRNQATTHIGQ